MRKIDNYRWEIEKQGEMNVPGRIYADEKILKAIEKDETVKQIKNVACLPAILRYSIAMPDAHMGYGLPIGGVAAFDAYKGIIPPGGVGSDINCGVRVLKTQLEFEDIKDKVPQLMNNLFDSVPSGVGVGGDIKLNENQINQVLKQGTKWAVKYGYGIKDDIENTENQGCMELANPENVSNKAKKRGYDQAGTLGSGNHFIEVQRVEEIFYPEIAGKFGLFKNQILIMIHSGSRGLGHQVCEDYVFYHKKNMHKYNIKVKDKQLSCVPIKSKEGEEYLGAMGAAANFGWVNRQILMHRVRKVFKKMFSLKDEDLQLLYDVAHNIAKLEEYVIDGKEKKLCVLRKGATRSFPPGHKLLPSKFKITGQPIIIPGDMGRVSYILSGREESEESFYSVCHGSGRSLSRRAALKQTRDKDIFKELSVKGIELRARHKRTVGEEASIAYKDIDNVVNVVVKLKFANKVAKLRPMGVLKG